MSDEINYKNNPLNGVGLKALLTEVVDYYGFEILFAYLSINCFKTNPSIDASVKFLKKTDWAREKVEAFYLYEFKNLPTASSSQLSQSPRARIIPDNQSPGEPAQLNLEGAERLREEREKKAAAWDRKKGNGSSKRFNAQRAKGVHNRSSKSVNEPDAAGAAIKSSINPWAKWKSK
jgi:uncharacterized protein (DUF2132 family)